VEASKLAPSVCVFPLMRQASFTAIQKSPDKNNKNLRRNETGPLMYGIYIYILLAASWLCGLQRLQLFRGLTLTPIKAFQRDFIFLNRVSEHITAIAISLWRYFHKKFDL